MSLFARLAPRLYTRVTGCGVERWDVKTGTDPYASKVVMSPISATIPMLAAFAAPPVNPTTRLPGAPEEQLYTIAATLFAAKMEADSDYHLALRDAEGNTMIAEVPCPKCCAGSPWLTQITTARATVDKYVPGLGRSFTHPNVPVVVTGVGFLDRIHGQTGVAPNGVELHPVLDIQFPQPPQLTAEECKAVRMASFFGSPEPTPPALESGRHKLRLATGRG